MKGERKLSLVKPPPSSDLRDSGAEDASDAERESDATPEELREAEELRRALERGDEPVALALRSAYAPASIEGGDLDAILARAMGDLDAPATSIERDLSERLRSALDEHDALRSGKLVAGPGARTSPPQDSAASAAVALRAAWAPTPISAARNDVLVGRALAGAVSKVDPARNAGGGRGVAEDPPAPISLRRFRIGPRTIATMTAVVAMAAGVWMMVGRLGRDSAPAPAAVAQAPAATAAAVAAASVERAPRIAARSTQDLFDAATPFPRSGGESARVDRIATARAADLRANRFAAWGVR